MIMFRHSTGVMMVGVYSFSRVLTANFRVERSSSVTRTAAYPSSFIAGRYGEAVEWSSAGNDQVIARWSGAISGLRAYEVHTRASAVGRPERVTE